MNNAGLVLSVIVGLAFGTFVYSIPSFAGRLIHRRKTYYSQLLDQLNRFDESSTSHVIVECISGVLGAGLLYGLFRAPVMAVLGGAAGLIVPGMLLRMQLVGRRRRLDELYPDALISLSSSVGAGLSLPDAIEQAADNMPAPASEEFELMNRKYKSGMTMPDVLRDAALRLNSKYFDLIAVALSVNIERGGDLTEILERISTSLREIYRLEEKIRTETAGPRFEGRIMLFAPPFVLGMLYMVEPELVNSMLNSIIGFIVLIVAAAMMAVAFVIMNRIVNEDV